MTRLIVAALLVLCVASPASAQFAVIDIAHLKQAVIIVRQVLAQLDTNQKQLVMLGDISAKFPGGLDRFRTPGILPSMHDSGRYAGVGPLLEALNGPGDPRAEIFYRIFGTLPELAPAVSHLPEAARVAIERQLAHLQLTDAVATRGIHQKAQSTGYSAEALEAAIVALEDDIVDPRTAKHYLTARLDLLTAASGIQARQDGQTNQSLATVVENVLLQSKEARDVDLDAMNMRLTTILGGADAASALTDGTSDAIRNFRLP